MKRRDEVTVGILLTVTVIVLITGTLWLVRGGLSRGYPLHVRFAWGHSLKQGQAVSLAGVTVGYVQDVKLNPDGFLDVDLTIRNAYKIPKTAVAEVFPVGIFGDVIVAMRTGAPTSESYAAGDTVPAKLVSSGGLDGLTAKADSIATGLLALTKTLEKELIAAGTIRDLRRTVSGMNDLVTQMQGAVTEQNKNITFTLAKLNDAVDSVDAARTARQLRATAASADSLFQRTSSVTTQMQALLARLERGEGSAGKFLADTMMYHNARNLMATADSLLADIKKNPRKYFNFSIF